MQTDNAGFWVSSVNANIHILLVDTNLLDYYTKVQFIYECFKTGVK